MPRPTFGTPFQPKNKPQGGGIPAYEGRPVDARFTMGVYMQAAVERHAEEQGISQSAWIRNAVRYALEAEGTVIPRDGGAVPA